MRSSNKLAFLCPKGHTYISSWDNFRKGNKCISGVCNKQRKRIEDVIKEFSEFGYTLLEGVYLNSNSSMKVECPEGHIINMTRGNFINQHKRCIVCYNIENVISFEDVKSFFDSVGYVLLSDSYTNNHTYLDYACNKGHKSKSTWGNFRLGRKCKFCQAENHKIDIKVVKKELCEYGYTLVGSTYEMAKESFEATCPKGHKTSMYLYNFRRGCRCGVCDSYNKMSRPEKEIVTFIKSFYSGEVLENSRKIIPPFELDIYIPEKKLAIEYNGLYWHSEEKGKDKHYHKNKYNLCKDKDIRLITIFEDEYLEGREKILNRVKGIIDNPKLPVYTVKGGDIISDLRWDSLCSKSKYREMGYTLSGDVGPEVYKVIKIKRQKAVNYSNVWDCGKVVYIKS